MNDHWLTDQLNGRLVEDWLTIDRIEHLFTDRLSGRMADCQIESQTRNVPHGSGNASNAMNHSACVPTALQELHPWQHQQPVAEHAPVLWLVEIAAVLGWGPVMFVITQL